MLYVIIMKLKKKNKYKITYVIEDNNLTIIGNEIIKVTIASSEKQAINNIKFRDGLYEHCICDFESFKKYIKIRKIEEIL